MINPTQWAKHLLFIFVNPQNKKKLFVVVVVVGICFICVSLERLDIYRKKEKPTTKKSYDTKNPWKNRSEKKDP